MPKDPHHAALESMYRQAPINEYYAPVLDVAEGAATVSVEVSPKFFHAAQAVHGSVYFKVLDDAAFFAAASLEREVFVLTTSFTTYLTRPVSSGILTATGRVVNQNRSQFIAEAVARDSDDREVGRASGIFVRSPSSLRDLAGYDLPDEV